jgi:predicted DNA-binding transcriptional regulator YafY
MPRAARLLDLLQALRRHRRAVTAAALAEQLGVSPRTVYRDIGSLRAIGAPVDGEAGTGFRLRAGFTLPPLMFTADELDVLALGLGWVVREGDPDLVGAARDALAKVAAVLPAQQQGALEMPTLIAGPVPERGEDPALIAALRQAIRAERTLEVRYRDKRERATARTIWPLAVAFFHAARVVVAWCELRQDFRHFRTDRLSLAGDGTPGGKFPRARRVLLAQWRATIDLDDFI